MATIVENIDRINVLGVGVSSIDMARAIQAVERWYRRQERHYVCLTGVHGVMESHADPRIRRIHNEASMVAPDGMPMVWLNWLHGRREVDRVYGPDLMVRVCESESFNSARHFFYGSTEETLALLTANLTGRFPHLLISGTYSPPFRELTDAEVETVANLINESKPDFVWVGLSTPKQELWMSRFRPLLSATALFGVGAAFDFHAGTVKQAPKWVQRSGGEWLFRLMMEPKRLWKRYLRNNPQFVFLICCQALRIRRYDLDPGHSG